MDQTPPRPSALELEVLHELWERGPLTVRDIHQAVARTRQVVYTTILKTMQVMHEKGLLVRDESQRSHVYSPTVAENDVKNAELRDLIDRVYGGQAAELALHVLATRRASSAELKQIRDYAEELDTQQPGGPPAATSKRAADLETQSD